jgi:HlyD family secretion protein
MSGTISRLAVELGERVVGTAQMAGTEIVRVADLTNMEVEVDVNEAFINRVVAGQPAVANLNAYPKWDIPANVIAIIQQRTEIKQQ